MNYKQCVSKISFNSYTQQNIPDLEIFNIDKND